MERKEQDVDLCVEKLWSQIKKQGLASLCKGSYLSVSMAQIRKQDIYACLNRYRGLKNLEEKIREEMEENFKCIAGGSDGWKSWNDRICRRYVSK